MKTKFTTSNSDLVISEIREVVKILKSSLHIKMWELSCLFTVIHKTLNLSYLLKKFSNLSILLILISFFGCENQIKQNETISNDQVKQVIIDYFKAISDNDFEGMKMLSTHDYVLYEDGKIWNNDSLINLIKTMPQATMVYEFKHFNVKSDCNGAFINYLNHGILTLNDTTRIDFNWIESAYVKKEEGKLKLDFLHSTVKK